MKSCDAVSWSEPPHVRADMSEQASLQLQGCTEETLKLLDFLTKWYQKRRERGLTTRLTRCEFQFSFSWSKNSWWPDALFVTRFSALVWAETGQIQIMIQFSCTMQGLNTNLTSNGRSKKVGSLCCHRTASKQFGVVNAGLASFKWVFSNSPEKLHETYETLRLNQRQHFVLSSSNLPKVSKRMSWMSPLLWTWTALSGLRWWPLPDLSTSMTHSENCTMFRCDAGPNLGSSTVQYCCQVSILVVVPSCECVCVCGHWANPCQLLMLGRKLLGSYSILDLKSSGLQFKHRMFQDFRCCIFCNKEWEQYDGLAKETSLGRAHFHHCSAQPQHATTNSSSTFVLLTLDLSFSCKCCNTIGRLFANVLSMIATSFVVDVHPRTWDRFFFDIRWDVLDVHPVGDWRSKHASPIMKRWQVREILNTGRESLKW